MLGFPLGVLFANGFEWFAHKYILHGIPRDGQSRYSPFPKNMRSHWAHHKEVRLTNFHDQAYEEGLKNWRTRNEVASLLVLTGATTLMAPVAPFFTLGTYYGAVRYFYVHRKAHRDPAWGRQYVPWHYDHHMNKSQDANWCVTRPWFDYLMGTRVMASAAWAESNPLGWSLPAFLEKPLNRWSQRWIPSVYTTRQIDTDAMAAGQEGVTHG